MIGFDDTVLAELITPALTTVRQPLDLMAKSALDHVRRGQRARALGESLLMRPEPVGGGL